MNATDGMSRITYARTRPELYVVALGDEKVGNLRGNFATGFWAYLNDGTRLDGTYDDPGRAAEVLALSAIFRAPEPVSTTPEAVRLG